MKKRTIILSAILASTMVACEGESKNESKAQNSDSRKSVETCAVVEYDGEYVNQYSGVVEASEILPLSFPQNGTIEKMYVKEGDRVKKGQLLAELNKSYATNMHQVAKLSQQQAQDAYDRLLPMYEKGTLPEIKFIEVQTGLNQANSSLQMTQKGISDCNLYAPTNGVIGRKEFQAGMNVLPTVSVMELYKINSINVKIEVPENEINRIKKGDSAKIFISAINKSFIGKISEIGIAADMLSHTYSVNIQLENKNHEIKPGMIASVTLNGKSDANGFLVPNKALAKTTSGQSLFLVENEKVKEVPVKTLALLDNQALVVGEIDAQDRVVYSGQQKIQDGASVRVIK